MTKAVSPTERAAIIDALRMICAIAPACSDAAEALNIRAIGCRFCEWRHELRRAQEIARAELHRMGEEEQP